MNILKELETLNKEIVSATREMNQAEGKKTAMTETLKKEFSISPDEVADSLDEINEQLKNSKHYRRSMNGRPKDQENPQRTQL